MLLVLVLCINITNIPNYRDIDAIIVTLQKLPIKYIVPSSTIFNKIDILKPSRVFSHISSNKDLLGNRSVQVK